MKNLLICSSFIIFLLSCGPKISPSQQKQLKSLTTKVDSITAAVNELDSAKLGSMVKDFFDKKKFIQNEMVDTLKASIIFRLDSFLLMRKGMGYIGGQYSAIKKEANTMQQQMKDLNHDVENRLVEEKQFDRYFQLENENYQELEKAVTQLVDISNKAVKKYDNQIPFVDSLINAYKKNMNE